MISKFGLEIKNRCTKEGVNGEKLTSIPKFGLEIKNRCMKEGENGEKLTSILKSGPEIKNRCTQEGENGEKLTSIRKFGPEIKNRCTKGKRIRGFEGLPSHLHRESAGGIPASTKKIPGDCGPRVRPYIL